VTGARFRRAQLETIPLIEQLYGKLDGGRMLTTAEELVRIVRGMDFRAYGETARAAADRLEAPGIETTLREFPTGEKMESGKRVIGEAWAIRKATLTAVAGDGGLQRIADFAEDPFSVIGWSAGANDEAAEVRIADDFDALARKDVTGKVVLTRSYERSLWGAALDAGARAVVVDSVVRGIPDAKRWIRFGWSGWPVWTKRRGPGFSLSLAEGDALRRRLAKDPGLRLAAHVNSRFYDGAIPAVDAVIRGTGEEEVVVVAHLFEPGALDNASGCATVIAAMRALGGLVAEGKLPRPRRTIRALLSFEVFGFERYLREQPEIAGRWKGLVCVDGAGPRYETSRALPGIFLSAPGWPTVMDAIAYGAWRGCVEGFGRGGKCLLQPRGYYMDDCIANRVRGLPGVAFGAKTDQGTLEWFRGYHSSADNMDYLCGEGLVDSAGATGATAYLAASAGGEDAAEFVKACERLAQAEAAQAMGEFGELVQQDKNPYAIETEAARLAGMTRSRMATIADLCGVEEAPGSDAASERVEKMIDEEAGRLREQLGGKGEGVGAASEAAAVEEELKGETQRLFPLRVRPEMPSFDTIEGHGDLRGRLGRDNEYGSMLDAADGTRSVYDLWTTAVRVGDHRPLAKSLDAFRIWESLGVVRLEHRL